MATLHDKLYAKLYAKDRYPLPVWLRVERLWKATNDKSWIVWAKKGKWRNGTCKACNQYVENISYYRHWPECPVFRVWLSQVLLDDGGSL